MAQSQTQTQRHENDAWAAAAERCGYAVHNGRPVIGIAPNEGAGLIVPVPEPVYFSHVTDPGLQENVFRAVVGHATRVGQGALKAFLSKGHNVSDADIRQAAEAGVASAVLGTYQPSRERGSDILSTEADRMFENHVRARVLASMPAATEDNVLATVKKHADTQQGKTLIAEFRKQAADSGVYSPRRGSKATTNSVDISL